MSPLQPSALAPEATFTDPLELVDLGFLGDLSFDVRDELEDCLRAQLQAAENTLRGEAMLTPSGTTLDTEYTLETLMDYDADYAYDDESVLSALNTMARQIRDNAAKLQCIALGYFVHVRQPAPGWPREFKIRRTTEWREQSRAPEPGVFEAVAVDLEHRSGSAARVFMSYAQQDGRLLVGDLRAVPSRRRIWAGRPGQPS